MHDQSGGIPWELHVRVFQPLVADAFLCLIKIHACWEAVFEADFMDLIGKRRMGESLDLANAVLVDDKAEMSLVKCKIWRGSIVAPSINDGPPEAVGEGLADQAEVKTIARTI